MFNKDFLDNIYLEARDFLTTFSIFKILIINL